MESKGLKVISHVDDKDTLQQFIKMVENCLERAKKGEYEAMAFVCQRKTQLSGTRNWVGLWGHSNFYSALGIRILLTIGRHTASSREETAIIRELEKMLTQARTHVRTFLSLYT